MEGTELIYYHPAGRKINRYWEKEMSPREVINRREELRYLLRNSIYNNLTDMQLDDSRMSAVEKRYMIFEDPDGYERYISRKNPSPGKPG